MAKKIYGKAMKTGWILTLIGVIGTVVGFNLGGSTGNDVFFALMALGVLLLISGIATVGVYAAMERRLSRALKDSAPLLRFTISAQDYAPYAAAQAEEIRSTNKMSLVIALVFCGLMAIGGPLLVKESGIIYTFTGIGLALFLISVSWIATKYRINKLNTADKEVVLTLGSAYVGGQFHTWKLPVGFLSEAAYFKAGESKKNSLAMIRITYNAFTRTIVTPYTILIPVPAGMEEKARAAVEALQKRAKKAKVGK